LQAGTSRRHVRMSRVIAGRRRRRGRSDGPSFRRLHVRLSTVSPDEPPRATRWRCDGTAVCSARLMRVPVQPVLADGGSESPVPGTPNMAPASRVCRAASMVAAGQEAGYVPSAAVSHAQRTMRPYSSGAVVTRVLCRFSENAGNYDARPAGTTRLRRHHKEPADATRAAQLSEMTLPSLGRQPLLINAPQHGDACSNAVRRNSGGWYRHTEQRRCQAGRQGG
jgi:hypothetical protein